MERAQNTPHDGNAIEQDTAGSRRSLKVAVLFDGAGLARLGLERAGHRCTGYELNPIAVHLGDTIGSGNCVLKDVADLTVEDLAEYDAIWASPPCQQRSSARTQGGATGEYAVDFLGWCFRMMEQLPDKIFWIENVTVQGRGNNAWGNTYNAAQFGKEVVQNRNRILGGRYPVPEVQRPYKKVFKGACPCITASEYKGCASDSRRASRWYGRRVSIPECAYHMGLNVPEAWADAPEFFEGTAAKWRYEQWRAIGNGVPVYMAQAFGEAAALLPADQVGTLTVAGDPSTLVGSENQAE